MPRQPVSSNQIYQLKITLRDSKPPIWRRVEVPDTVTLAQLHQIIQAAMGWYDSHLHQFTVGRVHYGVPDPDDFEEVRDERRVRLNQILAVRPGRSQPGVAHWPVATWVHAAALGMNPLQLIIAATA